MGIFGGESMQVKGYGTFVKKGEHIFRTDAKITFGQGTGRKILAIGLNPGASKLSNQEQWNSFLSKDCAVEEGEIVLDRTMLHIQSIILDAVPTFNGTVYIQNLMNYRNGDITEALRQYQIFKAKGLHAVDLETNEDLLLKYHSDSVIWLGWSQRESALLNARKKQVMSHLSAHKDRIIAKYKDDNPNSIHVWHFNPQLKSDSDSYRTYIVPKLRNALTR
jgi:hypothetical protein